MGFRLHTLGHTGLESEEPLPPGLTAGRPLALLVYLALTAPRTIARAQLADMLWRDRDEAGGRRALRQALYVVRKALPTGALVAENDSIRWNGPVAIDVTELEEAARGRRPARSRDAPERGRGGGCRRHPQPGAAPGAPPRSDGRLRLHRIPSSGIAIPSRSSRPGKVSSGWTGSSCGSRPMPRPGATASGSCSQAVRPTAPSSTTTSRSTRASCSIRRRRSSAVPLRRAPVR